MANRQDWVVKANELINARYDWTVLQQRMVLMMIAQLDMDADDFGNQTIEVGELLDKGQVSGHAYYERAAEAAHVLLDQKIFIRQPSGRWRGYNLLSYVEPGPGYVIARFNPDMRPFLLQLKRRFTKYMLENVMRFQSPYSTRIYELAQQYADIGHRTIPLDALREMLAVEDKYPRFYDFQRRVLDQAQKEVNKFTDLDLRYDVIRDGRQPVAVRLHMKRKGATPRAAASQRAREAQTTLDFDGLEAARQEAFERWWQGLGSERQEQLTQEAVRRFDPFLRQLYLDNPAGVAAQAALKDTLHELFLEQGKAVDEVEAPTAIDGSDG